MALHWWERPPEEQKRIRRWATKELKERLAEDVQRRLEVGRLEERQRAAVRATRCAYCRGTGRARFRREGTSPPEYVMGPCPCTVPPAEDATP